MKTSHRMLNIELLRIISMLMIVTLHFLGHGGVLSRLEPFSASYYICWLIEGICFLSITCYVLISGYFIVNSQFRLKKLLILLGQTFFYSVIIYLIVVLNNYADFSPAGLFKALLPTTNSQYWFITIYAGMYLCSPLLNMIIHKLSRKELFRLIVFLIIFFSLLPTFLFFTRGFNFGGEMGIVWFIVVYMTGAYMRLYHKDSLSIRQHLLLLSAVVLIVPVSRFVIEFFINNFASGISAETHVAVERVFYHYNSIFVFAAAVLLFMMFLKIKIRGRIVSSVIAWLAPLTLGVYLIHDNIYVRKILWGSLKVYKYMDRWYFPVISLFIILTIYVTASAIEFLRSLLFKRINESRWLDTLSEKITVLYRDLLNLLYNICTNQLEDPPDQSGSSKRRYLFRKSSPVFPLPGKPYNSKEKKI